MSRDLLFGYIFMLTLRLVFIISLKKDLLFILSALFVFTVTSKHGITFS